MPTARATSTSAAARTIWRGKHRVAATEVFENESPFDSAVAAGSDVIGIDDSPQRGQTKRIPPTAAGRSVLQNGQVRDSAIIVPKRGSRPIVGIRAEKVYYSIGPHARRSAGPTNDELTTISASEEDGCDVGMDRVTFIAARPHLCTRPAPWRWVPVAFLAVCPACEHSQICVLDNQVRPRVLCSNCRTVFEAGAPPMEPMVEAAVPPATRSMKAAAPAVLPKPAPPPRVAWPDVLHVKSPAPIEEDDDEVLPPRFLVLLRKWMNPLGAVGLGLCALALLVAAIGRISFLVPLLAAAAIVVGLLALRRARREHRPQVMPATAASLGTVLFLFAIAVPAALGPSYESARDSAPIVPDVQVLPHPKFAQDPDLIQSGWVDASKAGQQQGRVRVEVTDVWIELPPKGAKTGASELSVRIRLQRSKTGAEMAAGSFSTPLMWDERVQATLLDSMDSRYTQKPTPPGRPRAAGPSSAATVTVDVSHELLVFDAPAAPAQGLRLELPASAWGGTGTLKFSIPGTMVRTVPAPGRSK